MKKIISLILVLVVVLSLAACGGKKEAAVQNKAGSKHTGKAYKSRKKTDPGNPGAGRQKK